MITVDESMLKRFPPMGIYEVLFSFLDSTGTYLGNPDTHPWAQGYPLTTRLPNGPEIPGHVEFDSPDLKYPPATGVDKLLEALRDYYNYYYGATISTDNIAVFAGGRPGIFACLTVLKPDVQVIVEETEYTPYFDILRLLQRPYATVESNEANRFRPTLEDYESLAKRCGGPAFVIKSNPCNPTGVTWSGENLKALVEFCAHSDRGGIIDEAYEFFHTPDPVSSMRYIKDIDETNIFVVGAATKGLQVPGMRVGWVVASKRHIELFRNYSSFAMGGVARPSQLYIAGLLERKRVKHARTAVVDFFSEQRERYAKAFNNLGIEIFTGTGGFYHWGRLPNGLSAKTLNNRLYAHKAAVLPGAFCDMHRRGEAGPFARLFRFSFGAQEPADFDENIEILRQCLVAQKPRKGLHRDRPAERKMENLQQ